MFCTKCGAQLPDNARFCHVCGQAQTAEAGQPAREPQGAASAPQPAPPAAQVQAPVQTITAAAQAVQGAAAVAGAAKKGLSGAKIFLIVVVLAALCGGGYLVYQNTRDPADGIRETVADFQAAYNRQDVKAMLDCFDPAYTAIYQGALSLVGDLAGFDLSAAVDGLFGLAAALPPEAVGVEYPTLEVQVASIDFLDEYNASVTLTFIMTEGGESGSMTETVTMIRQDNTWYFSGEGLFW